MTVVVETTTAWGAGLPLGQALERLFNARPSTTHVELSVGARPGVIEILDRYPEVVFIGHHCLPLGHRTLRPTSRDKDELLETLKAAGIKRYTVHPPHRKHVRGDIGFRGWCESWLQTFDDAGIQFGVETMYTPRTKAEQETSGGYFLATPAEVWGFAEWAVELGWASPLVIDASHLFIGFTGGGWTEKDVTELLRFGPAAELHVSENDGRRDLHRPVTVTHPVSSWLTADIIERFRYVVPEGKHPLFGRN